MRKTLIAAALTAGILSSTAIAAQQDQFSALQGIEAQPMSTQEMAAVEGQITLADITAAITAKWGTTNPKFAAALIKYATYIANRFPKLLPYLTAKYGI